MKAKKSLGQHFLTDSSVLAHIRDEIDPAGDDIIIEVGPGMGALTRILLIFAGKVIAIEKDHRMIKHLKKEFAKELLQGKLELLERDILLFDFSLFGFYDEGYKIVGNIPYYLTGALLRKIFEAEKLPEHVVFLLQKEVAERIVASDGKESILSLSIRVFGTPTITQFVPRTAFSPAPNVDSAVLSIENISRENFLSKDFEKRFFEIIRAGFEHKRKYLIRNLEQAIKKERLHTLFQKLHIPLSARAEELTLMTWLGLTNLDLE